MLVEYLQSVWPVPINKAASKWGMGLVPSSSMHNAHGQRQHYLVRPLLINDLLLVHNVHESFEVL